MILVRYQSLQEFQQELKHELHNILQYWMQYSIDWRHGGFYGSISNDNRPAAKAVKGIVLNTRILWTFSAAFRQSKEKSLLKIADRAFDFITEKFIDRQFGGVYWSVGENGNMLEGRKQIYGLAFCIYGMSGYAAATNKKDVLDHAIRLYNLIEKYSFDPVWNGYYEAFSREWGPLDDLRLSAKDANEKKTMNTHLHIIEAYAALYKVWPNENLEQRIENLLAIVDQYFINHETHHLRLFFDEQWNERAGVISYGHDIEAAWLLLQSAEIIDHKVWIKKFQQYAIELTNAAMRGLDKDGGLWYEYEQDSKCLVKEKHWWPQAEAMIGFFNAYQLTNDGTYLKHAMNSWDFIKSHLLDKTNGEWFWGVNEDYSIMQGQDKAGFWKCPYHNARACMEVIARIETYKS